MRLRRGIGRGRVGELASCHWGWKESRTAHDGRREWALSESESASRRAPRKGGGGTLEEHCPARGGGMGGVEVWNLKMGRVWRSEVGASLKSATARRASDWLD